MKRTTLIALLMSVGALGQFGQFAFHAQRGTPWRADLLIGLMCAASAASNANASLKARKARS